MQKVLKIVYITIIVSCHNFILADFLDSESIKINTNKNSSCLIYEPFLGVVTDIENLNIKSDKFEITEKKILILNDNVEIDFPDGLLKTRKARVDRENGIIEFKKNGELLLKDFFFKSADGIFNRSNSFIELRDGKVFLNQRNLIIDFESLKGNIEEKVEIKNISMTSCSDTSKGWELIAENIFINDKSKRGYAKKVKVNTFDKTILKLPFLPFATSQERLTGFLEPKISYSSDGLDFMVPYYFVVSDKSDITVASRNISERGPGIEGNFRNLHGNNNNLRNIDLIYFNTDDEYKKNYPSKSESRWAFALQDSYGNHRNFWVDLDWSKSSDSLLLRDIPGDITSIGNQREQNLKQNIKINSNFRNFKVQISQEGYQTLNPILTNGYKKSPSIDVNYYKNFKNFSLREHMNYTNFVADNIHGFYGISSINEFKSIIKEPLEGSRIFYNLEISNSSYFNGYKISSSFGARGIDYDLENANGIKTKSVIAPTFNFDISTSIIKKNEEDSHIFKPRIFYGYVGYKNQENNPVFDSYKLGMMNQLFNINRFTGMDRVGDQNFYTLSIEYKKRHLNMNKISLKLSQKFYIKDRKVFIDEMSNMQMENQMTSETMDMGIMEMSMMPMTMMRGNKGPIVLMSKWMPSMDTMVMTYGSYSEEMKKFPLAGLTINHRFENGKIGYAKRYTRMSGDFNNKLDYSEFFADFKIKDNLSIIANFKRDDDLNASIESSFGIGYENCCFAFRIVASDKNLSRYLDGYKPETFNYLKEAWDNIIKIENKSRINFEFELKGLNSSFEKVSRFFNNSILDY